MRAPDHFEGVPRELGFQQGRAARTLLQRETRAAGFTAALERLGLRSGSSARWLRDVRRHFPHQAEWLEGAARGAGLPLAVLVRAARAALAIPSDALVAAGGTETLLACVAAPDARLRRIAPEGRFRSIELARPLLPAPQLGVNEAGLAVAASCGSAADLHCAAPAALLARDCLERFESVASALAWCLGRPAAPGAALLLADASGEVAGVELDAHGRRVRRPEAGVLVLGTDASRAARIAKRLLQGAVAQHDLAEALGSGSDACVCADPRARSIGSSAGWFALED